MNDTGAVKNKTKKTLPVITISVFLFAAAGLSAGCLTAYLLRSNIYASVFHLYQTLLSELQTLEINRQDFFLLAVRRAGKYFVLLWFFAFTNIWKYYYRLFSAYIGFQNGLLLTFCITLNGFTGIFGFVCFLLPQALLFIPAFLIAISHCDHLHCGLHSITLTRHRLTLCELPYFLLSATLVLLGCLMEANINPALLRLYFR